MQRLALGLALLLALCAGGPLAAEETRGLLTVTGRIQETNRGPFDPFRDALLGRVSSGFDRAFQVDQATLDALPQATLTLSYANWDGQPHVFTGPPLAALLERLGATGGKVSVVAADGYAVEHGMDVVQESGMLLATRMDGSLLPLGGFGPAWLVFEPGSVPGVAGDSDEGLVWAVILVTVE